MTGARTASTGPIASARTCAYQSGKAAPGTVVYSETRLHTAGSRATKARYASASASAFARGEASGRVAARRASRRCPNVRALIRSTT
ncbi:hypothetical protein AEGHOMDF_6030 [Methylobacterium soli]|nr:hypothetical protein AEGHOMDF_6030 [Methylobacterium soli]